MCVFCVGIVLCLLVAAVSGDDDEDAGEILQPATFGSLFRFCTNKDVIYLIIGILFNIAQVKKKTQKT